MQKALSVRRSGSLWLIGGLAVAVIALYFGMRTGGTKPVATVSEEPSTLSTIERFHELSSHSRSGETASAPKVDWKTPARDQRPAPRDLVRLPAPDLEYRRYRSLSLPLAHEALPEGEPPREIALADLSLLLFATAGITERRADISLRAAASAGALYPSEVYVVARDVKGLAAGVYSYRPEEHALAPIAGAKLDLERAGVPPGAPLSLVMTSVFQRSGKKYGDRTFRYVMADSGHALGNLLLAAREIGFRAELEPRFDEAVIARELEVDEREEGVASVVSVRASASPAPARPAVAFEPAPVEELDKLPLGITTLGYLATSLRLGRGAPASDSKAAREALPSESKAVALPDATPAAETTFHTVARRRTVRTFGSRPLELEELASVLRFSAGVPAELSHGVHTYVVTGRVQGLEPGVYEYDPQARRLLLRRPGDHVAAAGKVALGQDVIGLAHTVVVLTLDRGVLERGGPREYRHAFIEGGLIASRVYLEAVARRLGACSVSAFFDPEADELLGIDPKREWVIHFVALGTLP